MVRNLSIHLDQKDRERLQRLITDHCGLDASVQSDSALEQAVARRLAAHRLTSIADYWPILRGSSRGDREMNSLVQHLTNKETFFLRETHQFEVLRVRLLPELLASREQPLRVWSAGCATGEEPYSLAITLLEYQARHSKFSFEIVGTDIDATALEKARQGQYGERAVRLVPPKLRQRYFSFDGRTYRIDPEVAHLITFRVHNLVEVRCPATLSGMDVVFCRNITIYLSREARDRLNARLSSCLRPGGYLFVASSETMSHDLGRLDLVSIGNTFLFHKGSAADRTPPAPQAPLPQPLLQDVIPGTEGDLGAGRESSLSPSHPEPAVSPPDRIVAPAPSLPAFPLQSAIAAFKDQDYDAALRELDDIPADGAAGLDVHCLRAAVLLQQERLDEAEAACRSILARDPWQADAHFLLGLVFRQRGQVDEAVQLLKTAVYQQPEHRDAHFQLAETYRALRWTDQARREYKNTLNILRHLPRGTSPLSLTGLPDNILRRACEANLQKLEERQQRIPVGRSRA